MIDSDFAVEGGASSPSVRTDWVNGILHLQGDSYPENAYEFYNPVFEWVQRFLSRADRAFTLELQLLYLNTSSIKSLMDILDLMEDAHRRGQVVGVNWYYDLRNERVFELAEEFKEDCSFPFHIVGI